MLSLDIWPNAEDPTRPDTEYKKSGYPAWPDTEFDIWPNAEDPTRPDTESKKVRISGLA